MNTMRRPEEPDLSGLADLEAERRVLGILIKHPRLVDHAIDRVKPFHFSDVSLRAIYEVVLDLFNKDGRISYTQVYNRLRNDGSIAQPDRVLIGLTESFASRSELEPSVESLLEHAGRRRLVEAADKVRDLVLLSKDDDFKTIQAKAQEVIFQAVTEAQDEDVKDLMEVLNKCYVQLIERREGKKPYGLPVRYPAIDVMTTGFKNKDLIIVAARPSMGKTSLVLNFAVNVAKRNVPVLVFSLEMDDQQIGDRIIISELFRFRAGSDVQITSMDYSTRLNDEQFAKTQSVFNDLYSLPIHIIDKRGLTTADIRAKARKLKAEHPELGLIVIDYLQLIKPPSGFSTRSWTLVVGEIVRELRDLAGELDVPIILLSQLNRGVEQRENKRPVMSDLRDSGNIEEFADVVMFLYREDYYYPEKAKENGKEGQVEIIFAKQRKGPTGSCHLRFIKEYTKFVEETNRSAE